MNETTAIDKNLRMIQIYKDKFTELDQQNKGFSFTITLKWADRDQIEYCKGNDPKTFSEKVEACKAFEPEEIIIQEFDGKQWKKPVGNKVVIDLSGKKKPDEQINETLGRLETQFNELKSGTTGLNGGNSGLGELEKELINVKHQFDQERFKTKIENQSQKIIELQNENDELQKENEELTEEIEKVQGSLNAKLISGLTGLAGSKIGQQIIGKFGLSGFVSDGSEASNGGGNAEIHEEPENPRDKYLLQLNNSLKSLSEDSFQKVTKIIAYVGSNTDKMNQVYDLIQ